MKKKIGVYILILIAAIFLFYWADSFIEWKNFFKLYAVVIIFIQIFKIIAMISKCRKQDKYK